VRCQVFELKTDTDNVPRNPDSHRLHKTEVTRNRMKPKTLIEGQRNLSNRKPIPIVWKKSSLRKITSQKCIDSWEINE